MGVFDGLEKLINEHGSALILKERIELANDKYAALERKAAELDAENKNLKREVQELRKKLEDQEVVTAPTDGELDELGQRILLLLAKGGALDTEQIARALNVGKELAEFHIIDFYDKQFVYASHSSYEESTYSLDQEGRRYLVKRGLLK